MWLLYFRAQQFWRAINFMMMILVNHLDIPLCDLGQITLSPWTSGLFSVNPRRSVWLSSKIPFNFCTLYSHFFYLAFSFPRDGIISFHNEFSNTNISVFDQPALSWKGIISLAIMYKRLISCLVALGKWLMLVHLWNLWELWWSAHTSLGIHILCFMTHRMNNGPVLGHEEEVGRRTTFRLFYPESVFSDPNHNDPNTTAILTVFKPLDLKWLLELVTGGKIVSLKNWSAFKLTSVFSSWKKKTIHKLCFLYYFRTLMVFGRSQP